VAAWNHVRLFSSWSELVAPAAGRLLEPTGWQRPNPESYPTGQEWVARYLAPLAAARGERVRFGAEVVGVARRGRESEPLMVHVRHADGAEELIAARAVIDASDTWGAPNPLGGDGLPAVGEKAAADRIAYRVPDLGDADVRAVCRKTRRGGGQRAFGADGPGGVVRSGGRESDDPDGEADQLPARGALGLRANAAVDAGDVTVVPGFRAVVVERGPDRWRSFPTAGTGLRAWTRSRR